MIMNLTLVMELTSLGIVESLDTVLKVQSSLGFELELTMKLVNQVIELLDLSTSLSLFDTLCNKEFLLLLLSLLSQYHIHSEL
jgi:hypothetical protein